MRSKQIIHMVSCHAEGEVGNVIVGGVAPPPGDTLWEQARWIAEDRSLRNLVLNAPRGGNKVAILPSIRGRAWITGSHQIMLDPDDPWPEGYRLADTWPVK